MLDEQVRSNELEAIEKQKLEQRCITFEELVENLHGKVKKLDQKNEEANQRAELHVKKYNEAVTELARVNSAIEMFNTTVNVRRSALNFYTPLSQVSQSFLRKLFFKNFSSKTFLQI